MKTRDDRCVYAVWRLPGTYPQSWPGPGAGSTQAAGTGLQSLPGETLREQCPQKSAVGWGVTCSHSAHPACVSGAGTGVGLPGAGFAAGPPDETTWSVQAFAAELM